MSTEWNLPTARELERLPLRAIVAYAGRTAVRLSFELRGIIADNIIDEVLRHVNAVCSERFIGDLDAYAIAHAAGEVAGAISRVSKSLDTSVIASSLRQAALVAHTTVEAAKNPASAERCRTYAANRAEVTVRAIRVLDDATATAAADAARSDYEVLLREYGQHEDAIIGDPIDCFARKK